MPFLHDAVASFSFVVRSYHSAGGKMIVVSNMHTQATSSSCWEMGARKTAAAEPEVIKWMEKMPY